MNYDINNSSAPKMPTLGSGTECIKILLSQVSKDMREPLVPMLFPILGAHISNVKFQYPDHTWKEMCGMMANLVGDSGCNKGQLSNLVLLISCYQSQPEFVISTERSGGVYLTSSTRMQWVRYTHFVRYDDPGRW